MRGPGKKTLMEGEAQGVRGPAREAQASEKPSQKRPRSMRARE